MMWMGLNKVSIKVQNNSLRKVIPSRVRILLEQSFQHLSHANDPIYIARPDLVSEFQISRSKRPCNIASSRCVIGSSDFIPPRGTASFLPHLPLALLPHLSN